MSAAPRKAQKEIINHLQEKGIKVLDFEWTGSGHRWMTVTDGIKTAGVLISKAPQDPKAYHNIYSTARRALREAP